MSSVRYLREFVTERLTAAAEEIFRVFEKTIVEYQEELERQRRLLDIVLKPEIKLQRLELPHQRALKEEEVLTDQQLCNQARTSSLNQEEQGPPQIKEEQEELCSSEEREKLVVKQETETFVLIHPYKESDHHLLYDSSPVAESQDQEGGKHIDSESTRTAEPELKMRCCRNTSHSSSEDNSAMLPPFQCNTGTGKKSLQSRKAFMSKSRINIHRRVRTGEQPHVCNTCGKRFVRESTLNVHVRTHTGEKPHVCKTCGKRFNDGSNLKRHLIIHTGEKPHVCKTCGKRFYEQSKLKRHLIIHTGERPYICSTCGNRFNEKSKLNRHMITHTNSRLYSCDTCGRRFKDTSTLNRHLKIHTGERPFLCKMCGKGFSRTTHLERHMKVHTR